MVIETSNFDHGCKKTWGILSENTGAIEIKVGLHQGSTLSPLLFIVIMDVIDEDIGEYTPWAMLLADYLVLCDSSHEHLERRVGIWWERMERVQDRVSTTSR